MINPTSSQQGTPLQAALDATQSRAPFKSQTVASDQLSTAGTELLRAKLASEPDIRSDVVERGRQLAADPNYPSQQILTQVASKILNSPDPSEDQS